ncbi:tetratricopeptide repeat protein [Methylosinus sp. Sm6]|uniref:O-linked N-acetylglucosamine transferase, SPINDLY family protein n=1 Tax=Methylosinus sp. Sm6 TaxID=2866948 RepID=UPI001C9A027F|nr:tetratricopeptide repeat protein [Methylosinus sp. Sm6]MBY6242591.1 tetratricopeptide repeat protein [Methylosinus sp. Sm6]
MTIHAAFEDARAHHEAGRLNEAETLYRTILSTEPAHAETLHLLGLLAVERGAAQSGAEMIGRAMALAPGQAIHHNSLATAFRALGRREDAVREYRAAVALRPRSGELRCNLATALDELGLREEAALHYRCAAECAPQRPEIWYNLANLLAETGPARDAEEAFANALRLAPGLVEAQANYGRWLMRRGRWAEAATRLAEAARLAPGEPSYWNNLAAALQELGRWADSVACYERALALDPRFADAHYNLGCLLHLSGRTDEAVARHEAAAAADARHGAARIAACMAELPIVYAEPSEIAIRRARYAAALERLVAAAQDEQAAATIAPALATTQPFFLPYQGEDDIALQRRYGEFACSLLARALPPAPLAARPAPGERVRLGVVSGFFCRHTVFRLFLDSWLARLDRARFEVIGFHTGKIEDAETRRAAEQCDRFPREPATPQAFREAIVDAAPHVLLYPEIGMDPVAGWLAAQRLAPVQCMAWGQPETSGMPTMDYFLSSELMEPDGAERFYTERLVRLPNLGLHYSPEPVAPTALDRAALGIAPGVPVFWSGQALYKYHPRYDSVFPRIAAALGPCKFLFIAFAKSEEVTRAFRERLRRAFAAAGLDAEDHCVILPQMPQDMFVAAARACDVILDTPGWSGGRSTLDCLSADRPIVTLPGRFMRARHTAAILRRIGCEATIAVSLDDYVEIAVALGRDGSRREALSRFMAQNKSKAFEDMDYIRALEGFLERAARGEWFASAEPSGVEERA